MKNFQNFKWFEKSLEKLKKQIQGEENKNLQENLELVRSKRILMVENTSKWIYNIWLWVM